MSDEQYGIHPFAEVFPMMSEANLEKMAQNIKEIGLTDPIVLLEGKILDGRCRHAACRMAAVTPRFVDFGEPMDPLKWVWARNFHRRDLTPTQRLAAVAVYANHVRKAAKERMIRGGKIGAGVQGVEQVPQGETGRTRDIIAKLADSNAKYADIALDALERAPELIEEMRDGKLTILQVKARLADDMATPAARMPKSKHIEYGSYNSMMVVAWLEIGSDDVDQREKIVQGAFQSIDLAAGVRRDWPVEVIVDGARCRDWSDLRKPDSDWKPNRKKSAVVDVQLLPMQITIQQRSGAVRLNMQKREHDLRLQLADAINGAPSDDYDDGTEIDLPNLYPAERKFSLLTCGNMKKGSRVSMFSLDRCGWACEECSKECYAKHNNFLQHSGRYADNSAATETWQMWWLVVDELVAAVSDASPDMGYLCLHQKGDFYDASYLRNWADVIGQFRSFANLRIYFHTRCWKGAETRALLDRIAADNQNVTINLSTTASEVRDFGVPTPVGNGRVTYFAMTDEDLPPDGVDLVFRNLRNRLTSKLERLNGCLVCPHESRMYVAIENDKPILQRGKPMAIQCQQCCLCLGRSLEEWVSVRERYLGDPDEPAEDVG